MFFDVEDTQILSLDQMDFRIQAGSSLLLVSLVQRDGQVSGYVDERGSVD